MRKIKTKNARRPVGTLVFTTKKNVSRWYLRRKKKKRKTQGETLSDNADFTTPFFAPRRGQFGPHFGATFSMNIRASSISNHAIFLSHEMPDSLAKSGYCTRSCIRLSLSLSRCYSTTPSPVWLAINRGKPRIKNYGRAKVGRESIERRKASNCCGRVRGWFHPLVLERVIVAGEGLVA